MIVITFVRIELHGEVCVMTTIAGYLSFIIFATNLLLEMTLLAWPMSERILIVGWESEGI